MRELRRDPTCEVPSAVSSRQKIGHERQRVGRFVGRNVGRYFGRKYGFRSHFQQVAAVSWKNYWGMERVKGIEPSYSAWKAAALPLSYTRIFFGA